MRLIDADKLKEALCEFMKNNIGIYSNELFYLINNAPTIELKDVYQEGHYDGHLEGYTKAINEERPQGECRTCRHRDPEDKKCDCGGLERQGCLFPVSDDYFCKYYERETTFDDYLKEQLKDPEFKKEWDKLRDEERGGENADVQ